MSILYNNKSGATPQEILLAGNANTDQILNGTSKNAIANKAVYAALQDKVEKTVNDLVYYYTKNDTYNKTETRQLLSTISTMDIRVVNALPVSDISTTTIYFLKPTGSQNYDEYVYVDNAWVKIGDTSIDLSDYLEIADFNIAIADYYTSAEVDALINSYYTKSQIDTLLAGKQDPLTFDNAPTAGSNNPVTSTGINTALNAKAGTDKAFIPRNTTTETDMDDLLTMGSWVINPAVTVDNVPEDEQWGLVEIYQPGNNPATSPTVQVWYGANGMNYSRVRTGDPLVWTNWRRFGGTLDKQFDLYDIVDDDSNVINVDTLVNYIYTNYAATAPNKVAYFKIWVVAKSSDAKYTACGKALSDQYQELTGFSFEYAEFVLKREGANHFNCELRPWIVNTPTASITYWNASSGWGTSYPLNRSSNWTIEESKFSNMNLLNNYFFTVNQRGFNTAAGGGTDSYRFDRWHGTYGYNSTYNIPALSGVQYMIQHLNPELRNFLDNKPVTISILYSDNTLESGTVTYKKQPSNWITVSTISKVYAQIGYSSITDNLLNGAFCITAKNTNLAIKAVKLELGNISTLANDGIPSYVQELAKCRMSIGDPNDSYANQGSFFLTRDNGILGAKNLLPIEVSTQTIGGVTYTINNDGTMDVQGQNTSGAWISLNVCSFATLKSILSKYKGKRMIFSMTSDYDYDTRNVCLYYNIGGIATYIVPDSEEKTFTVPNNIDEATSITVPIGVNAGKTASTTNLGIMLRLASDSDSNYVPYAMTNRELTEEENVDLVGRIASGFTVGAGNFNYYRRGNTVTVRINGVVASATGNNQTVCTGLPKAKIQTFGTLQQAAGTVSGLAYIIGSTLQFNVQNTGVGLYTSITYQI